MNIHQKKYFFLQTYFFRKLDMCNNVHQLPNNKQQVSKVFLLHPNWIYFTENMVKFSKTIFKRNLRPRIRFFFALHMVQGPLSSKTYLRKKLKVMNP